VLSQIFLEEEYLLPGIKNELVVTTSFSAQLDRLRTILKKEKIEIKLSHLQNGFSMPEIGVHIWTDGNIFGRSYRRKSRFKKTHSELIESFIDLNIGDPIVHVNHGIGIYKGLKRLTAAGKIRDFLVLEYRDHGILYVPLDQMSLVQRYIGRSTVSNLDKIGSSKWKKTKERVAGAIKQLAIELVDIYSTRKALKGFPFPEDTPWQEEFEAAFEFEETPDQIRAIEEIKGDMEMSKPMDRLVCGDVGYGKTEVAIRAAFKSIVSGKQVSFICPTTILALQHYKNISRRFKNYPISVDLVSRFRTASQIEKIKQSMISGEVDIVVGTHAILNKTAYMKNLGLVIIDEEQRFGVTHKEEIKKIRKLVDVLTLTATPIPRTLHMSLVGLRDLSIINTPPANRTKIETYVMEENDEILKEAIIRETTRGGQIYFLHNRVESIEIQAQRLGQLLPEISIAILHGQLPENEIEDTLIDFQEGRYQLLVTTTIIESGIDIPNVNTLIVGNSDKFGLSQLYQIKGRVGRSNRQAYAYLFYNKNRTLSETAMKRLSTLQEFQDLGSGFKVAMRDLEIRGAGNLLGREQSGQIMEVGFDLYIQMLEEAVTKLKGEKLSKIRASVNLNVDLYIPDNYIPDTNQKVEFYQRLERASSDGEVDEILLEMEDRFGNMPDGVRTFIKVEKIRVLASILGIEKIYEEQKKVAFKISRNHNINPEKLVQIMSGSSALSVNPERPDLLYLNKNIKSEHLWESSGEKTDKNPQKQNSYVDTLLADIEKVLHGLK